MRSPQPKGCGRVESAGQRTVRRTPPETGTCISTVSVTSSMLDTRRSMRCVSCCAGTARTGPSGMPGFGSAVSTRTGPASTAVPSTVRRRSSDIRASSGAGAGRGCIQAHQAPSRHHRTPSGSQATRCALNAARQASPAARSSAISTQLGGIQNQCAATMPTAKSHAAWNRGMGPGAARNETPLARSEVGESACMRKKLARLLCGVAYRILRTDVSGQRADDRRRPM